MPIDELLAARQAQLEATPALSVAAVGRAADVLPAAAAPAAPVPQAPRLSDELTEQEEKIVDEALARGAPLADVLELIARWRGRKVDAQALRADPTLFDQPEPDAELAQRGGEGLELVPLGSMIQQRYDGFRKRIAAEFESFGPHVRAALEKTAALNSAASAVESYEVVRAMLYVAGWRDAKAIYEGIVSDAEAKVLGHTVFNGAHRLLVDKLAELVSADGLPEAAPAITVVVGFQPRRVEGTDNLSNHAWGLALDVDGNWNPFIKSKYAREIMLRHSDVDFGVPLIVAGAPVDELYARLKGASDKIKAWLTLALPVEKKLREAFAAAQSERKQAEAALVKAKGEAQRAQAATALEAAKQAELEARRQMTASTEVFEVGELRKEFDKGGRSVVDQWEKHGILTVPLDFVKRMKELGFGWGGEYKEKKDLMHFELDAREVLPKELKSPPVDGLADLEPPAAAPPPR